MPGPLYSSGHGVGISEQDCCRNTSANCLVNSGDGWRLVARSARTNVSTAVISLLISGTCTACATGPETFGLTGWLGGRSGVTVQFPVWCAFTSCGFLLEPAARFPVDQQSCQVYPQEGRCLVLGG